MKIERSPLELRNFFVLKNELNYLPSRKKINISEVYKQYPIDLDYFIRQVDQDFHVFITLKVNREKKSFPGCSVFVEGVGIFRLNEEENLKETDRFHLINFSAVGILINSLRTYILSLTAFLPTGMFTLPAIDMNALMKEKVKLMQQQTEVISSQSSVALEKRKKKE